jgi:hypothetical protein
MRRYAAPFTRLILVSTLIALPAAAATAAAGLAILQGVSYDAGRQALAIPFVGPLPTYELHQLSSTRAYFEIAPARYAGMFTLHTAGGGEFSKVTMATRPEGNATRLSFYLSHPGHPELAWDKQRHRLLITVAAATTTTSASTPLPVGALPSRASAKPAPQHTGAPTFRPAPTPSKAAPPANSFQKPAVKPTLKPQSALPITGTAPTSVRSVYFDNARGLLVVPFTGAVPSYQLSQPEPGALAIDFAGASLQKAPIRQDLEQHPLLRRWTAQDLPGLKPTMRLVLTLAASADVGVAQDPGLGAMLVIPEPLAQSAPLTTPAPPSKTRFATPVFDPRNSELSLTFAGRMPTYDILHPTPTTAYLDLPYAELIAGSMPFERVDLNPLLTFWLLAGRPAIEGQRLILHLPFGGDLKVTQDKANHRLVVKMVASQSGTPTPSATLEPTTAPFAPTFKPATPLPDPPVFQPAMPQMVPTVKPLAPEMRHPAVPMAAPSQAPTPVRTGP